MTPLRIITVTITAALAVILGPATALSLTAAAAVLLGVQVTRAASRTGWGIVPAQRWRTA